MYLTLSQQQEQQNFPHQLWTRAAGKNSQPGQTRSWMKMNNIRAKDCQFLSDIWLCCCDGLGQVHLGSGFIDGFRRFRPYFERRLRRGSHQQVHKGLLKAQDPGQGLALDLDLLRHLLLDLRLDHFRLDFRDRRRTKAEMGTGGGMVRDTPIKNWEMTPHCKFLNGLWQGRHSNPVIMNPVKLNSWL